MTPDEAKGLILRWTTEEGLVLRERDDPQASFNLRADWPGGDMIHVARPLDSLDSTSIVASLITEPMLRQIPDTKKNATRRQLASRDLYLALAPFLVEHSGMFGEPGRILIKTQLYDEALTKSLFFDRLLGVRTALGVAKHTLTKLFPSAPVLAGGDGDVIH